MPLIPPSILSLFLSLPLVLALPSYLTPPEILSFTPSADDPNLNVTICTGKDYTGDCIVATWPGNECIGLGSFVGHTLTFVPEEGVECFLMQGACDANEVYLDVTDENKLGCDLSDLTWAAEISSYTCWNASAY